MMTKNRLKIITIALIIAVLTLSFSAPLVLAQQKISQAQVPGASQPSGSNLAPQLGGLQGVEKAEQEQSGWFDWLFGSFVSILSKPLLYMSSIILKAMGFFVAWIIYFEAWIIDSTLNMFSITGAPIVKIGWGITRDLANMGFILALIVIAISTILGMKQFAAQQMLWRVIVAALLINFSLVIAGIIVDAAQLLTKFFVNAATGNNPLTFSLKLANAMDITAFYNPGVGSISDVIFGAANSLWVSFAGIALGLVASVVLMFVFGAAAVFLVIRVIHLWGLLILSPLAWASFAFPGQSTGWSKWWTEFLKWAFFAPIFTFFMYLSLKIFTENGALAPGMWVSLVSPGKPITYIKGSAPQAILQYVLMISLMIAGLKFANQFGYSGGKGAYNMLNKWGEGAKNFAGRQLRRTALGIGAVAAAPGVAAKPSLLVRGAQRAAALPGGRLLAGQVFKMAAAEAKTVEEAKGQFASWSDDAVKNYLKTPGGPNNLQMGAALALQERGKLEDLGEARIDQLAALASRYAPKNLDTVLKVAPALAPHFKKPGETDAEAIARITGKADKASEIVETSLIPEVVLNFKPEQFKDVIRNANDAKIQTVKNIVQREYSRLAPALQAEIDNVTRITNKDARNRELGELSRRDENAGKIARAKFTTESPAWEI